MIDPNLTALIADAARTYRIPPSLLTALVMTESAGNPWAIRYEPAFYSRYIEGAAIKPLGTCSVLTEKRARAMSWGLMQIMGATARDTGFGGVFLSELCDPKVGLEWGCRYLNGLARRYLKEHGWPGVIAAYNAGSPRKTDSGHWVNQPYVDKIAAAGGFAPPKENEEGRR